MRPFFLLLLLVACSRDESKSEIRHYHGIRMTIPYHFQIVAAQDLLTIEKIIETTFEEIDTIFNRFNPESELSKINAALSGISIPLSSDLASFLRLTQTYVQKSEGRFDPAVLPLILLWEKDRYPTPDLIEQVRKIARFDQFILSKNSVEKRASEASIDLSGICKGHFLDLLGDRLHELGVNNFLLEWGGEFVAGGRHPDNRLWQVAIKNPVKGQPPIAIVSLENAALATSGAYEQFWDVEGRRYFHIIDTETGYPLEVKENSIISTSVLAKRCSEADAIATTLMTFSSKEAAREWLQSTLPEITGWIVETKSFHCVEN